MFTYATTTGSRVPYLDSLRGRGIFEQFYDPEGERHGLLTYSYHWAPYGLYTIRQLRAKGLRPVARTLPRKSSGGTVSASASPTSTAKTSPSPSAPPPRRKLADIRKALRARRICPACRREKPY
jgi:hypothetical protein